MPPKPTYKALEARIKELEQQVATARRTETALKTYSKQWQLTFDAMKEALAVLDEGCRILQCNRAMRQLVNKSEVEIIGRHCWEVVHESDGPISACPCRRVQQSGQRESSGTRIGNRWFEVTVDPQFDPNGKISAFIHIMSDISEHKQAEAALR